MPPRLNYCFVGDVSIDRIAPIINRFQANSSHLLIGRERNPQNGLSRLQGYCKLNSEVPKRWREKYFPELRWLVIASMDIYFYINWAKDNNFYEYGKCQGYPKRLDLQENVTALTTEQVAFEFSSYMNDYGPRKGYLEFECKYPTLFIYLPTLFYNWASHPTMSTERTNIEVDWIISAIELDSFTQNYLRTNFPDAYYKPTNTKYFSGYMLDRTCIIHRIDQSDEISPRDLLLWFSKETTVIEESDCCELPLRVNHFIITSSMMPEQLYQGISIGDKLLQCIRQKYVWK